MGFTKKADRVQWQCQCGLWHDMVNPFCGWCLIRDPAPTVEINITLGHNDVVEENSEPDIAETPSPGFIGTVFSALHKER